MEKGEFEIGTVFNCGPGHWICTDIGSRVVVAIKRDDDLIQDGWLKGPPFAVEEHVFDENDIQGCELPK